MSFFGDIAEGISDGIGAEHREVSETERVRADNPAGDSAELSTWLSGAPNTALATTIGETASLPAGDSTQFQFQPGAASVYVPRITFEETAGQSVNLNVRVADGRDDKSGMKANPVRRFSDNSGLGGPTLTVNGNDIELPMLMKMADPQILLITATADGSNSGEAKLTVTAPVLSDPRLMGSV